MIRSLLFFLALCITSHVFAIRVNSIYQAELPVSSQTQQERDRILQDALAQVLIKVSGKTTILGNPQLKSQLSKAPQLMQEYGYSSADAVTMRFDPEGVNQLLRQANIPIWGLDRPVIVAWIAYENAQQTPQIISSDSESDIQTILKQRAAMRGIPLILPMMDLAALNQVTLNDVKTMAIPTLSEAAKRYSNDAILIVNLSQQANVTTSQAKLVMGKDVWEFKTLGNSLPNVLNNLVDTMTDALAARYATMVTNSVQKQLILKITGITLQEDFSQLMQYVQHITAVATVQPVKIAGTEVILRVNLRGANQAFIQAISLDKKLTPVQEQSNENMLVYEWNP